MLKRLVFILLMIVMAIPYGYSQCAMCKAVVESEAQNGGMGSSGINTGILYLMIFPYILFTVIGYIVYRHYKKNVSEPAT